VGSAAATEAGHILCFTAMLLALLFDASFPALLYELFFTGCPVPAVPYPLSFANLILAGVFG
jgi:hypothetical protein